MIDGRLEVMPTPETAPDVVESSTTRPSEHLDVEATIETHGQIAWIALAALATASRKDAAVCKSIAISLGCSARLFEHLADASLANGAIGRGKA